MKWNDATGRIVDTVLLDTEAPAQVGPRRRGAAVPEVLDHRRVSRERQQDLIDVVLEYEVLVVIRRCQLHVL